MSLQGRVLAGRYRLGGLIAGGGMADVYWANDQRLDRKVAVKVFRAGSADPARFRSETRLLVRLQHRHLVRLFDAGEHDGVLFIVLEFCPRTLAQSLAERPLRPDAAAEIGRGVALALAHVHAAGVVHRDVKPSNVLIGEDGHARLADFGVARLVDTTGLTATGVFVGTPAYLAPEQLGGGEVGPSADIYSLGLTLLEAMTGKPAFEGTHQELLASRLIRPPDVPRTLPPPWRSLLYSMTDRDPARRPSATVVAATLDPARLADHDDETSPIPVGSTASSTKVDATMIAPPRPGRRLVPPMGHRRRIRRWAAGAVALAAATVIGLLLVDDAGQPSNTPPSSTTTATTPNTTVAVSAAPAAPPPAATTATTDPAVTATVASTAPAAASPGIDLVAFCADLEQQKRAIDEQKREVDRQYRDDRETRERLKAELEEQKRSIDAQKRQLGC